MAMKLTKTELEALRKSTASGDSRNAMSKAQLDAYRKSKSESWQPIEYYKTYDLKSSDGKNFGKVSYEAYKAVENLALDSYKPQNDEEAKAISKFRKQASLPFVIEIDNEKKDFGKISYDAYKAIENGTVENYKPVNDTEKKAIAEYQKFVEDYAKKQREPENLGQGLLHGAGYTLEKLGSGAVSGLYDIGRFANAGFHKLLSIPAWGNVEKNLNETVDEALYHKGPGEMWDESIEERYRVPDWYRDNVGNTLSSIGQLAIPIIAEVATAPVGGASPLLEIKLAQSAAKAGIKGTVQSVAKNISTKLIKPKVSDAVFGLSAAGSSAKVGYRQSGDSGKALNYGVLNGLGEVATEKLFGGIGGTPIGADDELIDLSKIKGISKLASNKYGKKVLDIAFEGVEETIMAGADPLFQKATINPNANLGELYKNAGFGESFFQGILLSSLMNAGTYTVSKTINTTNKIKTINDLNKSLDEINATLPDEVKFKPLPLTATVDEIQNRHSDIQRVKGINLVNGATNGINVLFENDADKLEPLNYDSTIEEIEQRQNEIGVFTMAYADVMVDELVKNNPEKFAHIAKISVGDSFKDTKTGYTITVVDRDSENTTVQIDTGTHTMSKVFSNNQADAFATSGQLVEIEDASAQPVATTEKSSAAEQSLTPTFANESTEKVYNLLVGDKLTNKGISDIINTPELREAFTNLTGIAIAGTRSEQRAIVRNFQSNPENIAKLKQSVGALDSQNASVSKETATEVKDTPTQAKNVTDEEIAIVVDAINETLVDGALETIYASIPEGYAKSLDVWARKLVSAYNKTGNIGHIAEFFTDGGKKVISAIESVIDKSTTQKTVANTNPNVTSYEDFKARVLESNPDTPENLIQNIYNNIYSKKENTPSGEMGVAKSATTTTETRGQNTVAYTNDNQKIEMVFKVVSVDDLIASNDLEGKVNPDYPQELQPRDRSRVASKTQIQQMANDLNPERLAESTSVSEGAPIVGSDNVVESGNGRTLAIKLAYQSGTADTYRNYIINNAETYGIDVSNLPEKPLLVRERVTAVDRKDFVRKANESTISSMSATEQAKVDAERLSNDVLNLLVANEEGEINTEANKDFISAVVTKVFKNEDLNNVVSASGKLSARGLERITNAIFYKAYGDASLSARLSESLDNDMKNATKVLLNIAPRVVTIKNDIQQGESYDFDFSEDIASAVRVFEKCRNDNLKIVDYANQTSLFEKEKPLVLAMAYVFETKNRGAKQATEFYNLLLDTVEGMGSPNQISLGITDIFQTKEEILNAAVNQFNTGVIAENTARGIEPTKNTIAIPESIYRSESEIGRDDDRHGNDEVLGGNTSRSEKSGNAVGVQQDNGPSKERGVVTDDEQLRQKNESIERQSEIGEEDNNEQIRKDLLYGNGKRRNDGGSGKQTGRLLSFRRENQGKNATERRNFARELIERGQTEQLIDTSSGDTVKCNVVKPEAYNDDMRAMAEKAKAKGIELIFTVGEFTADIKRKDGTITSKPIRGVQLSPTRILVKYDHSTFSPQQIYKHEYCHAKWETPEMRKIRATIFSSLSAADRQTILSMQRYKDYMEGYNNNENLVWEEFVCDVMSGYSNYTDKFADVVTDFWYGNESVDSYNPSTYTTSTDAGGNKYSFDSEQYTKKEYRNFGWARANNILNAGQNADYRSKFADAKVDRAKFPKTNKGEYMIPVSDIYDKSSRGINNVLVFAKGTIANPVITSVIEIYAHDETSLDRVRRQIYDGEWRGIQQETGELFRRYFASDFKFQPNQQRLSVESVGNSSDNRHRGRSSEETSSVKEESKVRYSFDEKDSVYTDAVESGDMETAQRMVDEVAKAKGYNIRAYHGTRRGDRVGNVFLPERATSGPMAFFTDNKEIAENYAKSKQDTSMAYDPDYDSYETQFRIKMKNMDIPLYRAWGYLPFDARSRITQKAQQLRENWDGDNEFILDPNTKEANGGFQWQLKMARGNALLALNEQWLNSGTLFNEESRYLEVLEMAGVMEEFKKIGDIYFKDPNARHEKVYDTYLRITNPFDTSFADESFVDGLLAWYEEQDESQYERESMESDLWDKNSIDAYEFADRVRSDIERGTFHAWTSIPDSVTDYLKSLGYDGIKDLGGKNSDVGHTVWIPFSSEQIKSSEPVTYDDNGNFIPLSQRFKSDNKDIRYSFDDSYAPTFYSYMGKTIDEMKQEKIGANSVVSYLKGRGVKDEEIKWTGIEEFLEGKKSVTKAELQEFVAGSQLQIEEITLDNNEIPYTQEQTEQISAYESEREEIFDELKNEWKKAIGTEFPMQTFGLGLESSVGNLLMETDRQLKESADSGKEMVEAREQLRALIAKDDFGYDSANEAYYYATRDPKDFLDNYDLTDEEKAVFERFISAKENYKNAEGIPVEIQRHLKDIAAKSDDIGRKISRIKSEHTKENEKHKSKWDEYTLDGGENYREILFKIPNSDYSNYSMQAHWGNTVANAQGVLAHARIQDFDVDGKKMLFIEEIQSDWHNEGHQKGYIKKTDADVRAKRQELENYIKSRLGKENSSEEIAKLQEARREYLRLGQNMSNADAVPDAPFKNNYHEYVLKRLMRMAAEEGYDSIGWTPADIQSKRWSDEYAEGYRIEYDQDIPKFLNKYGKKWGTWVSKTPLNGVGSYTDYFEVEGSPTDLYSTRGDAEQSIVDRHNQMNPEQEVSKVDTMLIAGQFVVYDSVTANELGRFDRVNAPTRVWSMPITDAMKNSVLYEGQARYSLDTDGMLDLEDLWSDAIDKYGTIPKGEMPARDVDVPKKINKKDVVSRGARTMMEAGITPDWAVSEFEQAILDGTMTHEVITNKKASTWARQQIEHLGFEEALNRWTVLSDSGKVGKKELALGMELYNQCITNKDVSNAMKIAAELVAEATNAGQTLQAVRMLKRMSPDGQLYYLEKSVQKMNEEFKNKLGKKFKDIELDEDLMEEFLTAKDEAKRDEAYDKICQHIADQMPATLRDKWNSWRYLAMLGNLRTHIRNIVGNAVFTPSIRLKNFVGAVIESATKVDAAERTKSLHKSKEAIEFAKKDFDAMTKVLQGENAKYAVTGDIEGKRTIFKTKWLEKLRLKNFDFLEKEDLWFLKMHYVDALARLITIRKIDLNSVTQNQLETLRAYAIKEAQSATYRDANALADGLNAVQKRMERSDKRFIRGSSALIEGVMPFKKTPLNIAKQGIYYSPVGILKGIYTATAKVKKGDATVTDVIDDIAKGLSGTMVMMLGYFLASLGMLDGDDDKTNKEKAFDQMTGEQSYALKIGDTSYTIDWATPSNLALFVGAALHELTKDDFSFADVTSALSTVAEPLLELSVFSGINGVIESAQYSEGSPILAIISDAITSYMMQALPTIGGQISRIVDASKKEYYYVDKTSNVPKGLQRLIGQASSKIPFASYLFETSVDEWGREESYGNVVERAFENTVSPGYYSAENYTAVDRELRKLFERTGDSAVLPVIQQKSYTEDYVKYDMTAKEYTQVKKLRGKKSFELVRNLISSSDYRTMTDKEKVKAIKECYTDAGEYAKEQMIEKVKRNSK